MEIQIARQERERDNVERPLSKLHSRTPPSRTTCVARPPKSNEPRRRVRGSLYDDGAAAAGRSVRGLLQTINPQPPSPLVEGVENGPSKPIPHFDTAVASKFPCRQYFDPWKYLLSSWEPQAGRVGLTGHSSRFEGVADADLVEMASGDLDAYGELVRRHQDFVYGAALRVVRNPVLAEDVAQEAFVRAYKALPDFRGQAQVRSWLYRIATNLALNAVSRRREYPQDSMPEVATQRGPERETELALMRDDLESAIAELSPDLREALVLREFDGLSYQEIAKRLDLPLNTVRTRILRARRGLRSEMEGWR